MVTATLNVQERLTAINTETLPFTFRIRREVEEAVLNDGHRYSVIADDDADERLCIEHDTNELFLIVGNDAYAKLFVNTSLEQFIEALQALNRIYQRQNPNQLDDDEREPLIEHFKAELTEIDAASLRNDNTLWSNVIEEMEYGVI